MRINRCAATLATAIRLNAIRPSGVVNSSDTYCGFTTSSMTPIAMGITETIGGVPALAAVFAVTTGVVGAVIGKYVLDACRVAGWPARGYASATVLMRDPLLAQAMSKLLFIIGPDAGRLSDSTNHFEWLLILVRDREHQASVLNREAQAIGSLMTGLPGAQRLEAIFLDQVEDRDPSLLLDIGVAPQDRRLVELDVGDTRVRH